MSEEAQAQSEADLRDLDCPCGTDQCREAYRDLREVRDVIREEVARQFHEVFAEPEFAAAARVWAHKQQAQEAEVSRRMSPTIRSQLKNLQHAFDKLRATLEAGGS